MIFTKILLVIILGFIILTLNCIGDSTTPGFVFSIRDFFISNLFMFFGVIIAFLSGVEVETRMAKMQRMKEEKEKYDTTFHHHV